MVVRFETLTFTIIGPLLYLYSTDLSQAQIHLEFFYLNYNFQGNV